MFSTNKNIKVANENIAALTSQLSEAKTTIENLTKAANDIETLKKEHAEKVDALTKEFESKIKDLETAKVKADESAMQKARTIVTAMGIPEEQAHKEPVSPENDGGFKSKFRHVLVQGETQPNI